VGVVYLQKPYRGESEPLRDRGGKRGLISQLFLWWLFSFFTGACYCFLICSECWCVNRGGEWNIGAIVGALLLGVEV
jgi:hypothetical protein